VVVAVAKESMGRFRGEVTRVRRRGQQVRRELGRSFHSGPRAAQLCLKSRLHALLCATSVSSVSLWLTISE
jgi:hypothetical protein